MPRSPSIAMEEHTRSLAIDEASRDIIQPVLGQLRLPEPLCGIDLVVSHDIRITFVDHGDLLSHA